MEIEIGEIEKEEVEEVEEKKKNRKQYLYAVAVLGVVGLLLGMATGIPIGAQVAVPALSSVAYFFDCGRGGNGLLTWYYFHEHMSFLQALEAALASTGLGWLWEEIVGTPLILGIEDALAGGASAVAEVIVELAPIYLDPVLASILTGVAIPIAVY